jgi:hypothetical protein
MRLFALGGSYHCDEESVSHFLDRNILDQARNNCTRSCLFTQVNLLENMVIFAVIAQEDYVPRRRGYLRPDAF